MMWLLFEFYLSTDIDNVKAAYPDYRKAMLVWFEYTASQGGCLYG